MLDYNDLIKIVRTNLVERQQLTKHICRIPCQQVNVHSNMYQQYEQLRELIRQLTEQQQQQTIDQRCIDTAMFDHHSQQLERFNRLSDEYRCLQDENRLLKQQTQQKIEHLYTMISQVKD
jgi:hypothetical protein